MGLAFPGGIQHYLDEQKKNVQVPSVTIEEPKKESKLGKIFSGVFGFLGKSFTTQLDPTSNIKMGSAIYKKAKDIISTEKPSIMDPLLSAQLVNRGRAEELKKLTDDGVVIMGPDNTLFKQALEDINPEKYGRFSEKIIKQQTTDKIKRENYQNWLLGQGIDMETETGQKPLVPFVPESISEISGKQTYLEEKPAYSEITPTEGFVQPEYIAPEITEEQIQARIPEVKEELMNLINQGKRQMVKTYIDDTMKENPLVIFDEDTKKQMERNLLEYIDIDKLTYQDLQDVYVNEPIKMAMESGRPIKDITLESAIGKSKVEYYTPGILMAFYDGAMSGLTSDIIKGDLQPETPEEKISYTAGNIIGLVTGLYLTGETLKGASLLTKTGRTFLGPSTSPLRIAEFQPEVRLIGGLLESIGAFNIHGQLNPALGDDWGARINTALNSTTMAVAFAGSSAIFPGRISGMFPQIGLFAGLSALNGDAPEIIATNALMAALLHGSGFLKQADINGFLDVKAKKTFEKITGTKLNNGYTNRDLDFAKAKGEYKIASGEIGPGYGEMTMSMKDIVSKERTVNQQEVKKLKSSLDESYDKLTKFGNGVPENRIFKTEKNVINNVKRTVRQIKDEFNFILNTIDPNRPIKIKWTPIIIEEGLIPTTAGEPKITRDNEIVVSGIKSQKLTDVQINWLKSEEGKYSYLKRLNNLEKLYDSLTGSKKDSIKSRIEDLRGLGQALGYEGKRITDIIVPEKDKIFADTTSLGRLMENVVDISTNILKYTELGYEENIKIVRKTVADISETTGISERDITRELLRRTVEMTTGERQFGPTISEYTISAFLKQEPGVGGLVNVEKMLITQPMEELPNALRENLKNIKSPEERSALIEETIRREFPTFNNAEVKEYKEILGRAIKTEEPVELARKEIIKTKSIEERFVEVEKQIKKTQKNLPLEQVKKQETAAKLVRTLAAEEARITREVRAEVTTQEQGQFSSEEIKTFRKLVRLLDTKFATGDTETILKSKYGPLLNKAVEKINERLKLDGTDREMDAEPAMDYMRKLTEKPIKPKVKITTKLTPEMSKIVEKLNTSTNPSEIINEIAGLTKTTLESPIRIVVNNWEQLGLPKNRYITQMKDIVAKLKPTKTGGTEYFNLSTFGSKLKTPETLVKAEISPEKEKVVTSRTKEIEKRLEELSNENIEKIIKEESGREKKGLTALQLVNERSRLKRELSILREEFVPTESKTIGEAISKAKSELNERIDISTLPKEERDLLSEYGYKPDSTIDRREYITIIEEDRAYKSNMEENIITRQVLDNTYEENLKKELDKNQPNIGLSLEIVTDPSIPTGKLTIDTPITKKAFREISGWFKRSVDWAKDKLSMRDLKENFINKLFFFKGTPTTFKNDFRIKMLGGLHQVAEKRNRNEITLFAGSSDADIKSSIELIYLRDQLSRTLENKGNPEISLEMAKSALKEAEKNSNKNILKIGEIYRTLQERYSQELIDRGMLKQENTLDDHIRHYTVDYVADWMLQFGVPKRLKRPFMGYAKEAHGSTKAYRQDRDAILTQFMEYDHDIMQMNYVTDQCNKYDIKKSLSREQLESILGINPKTGRIRQITPNTVYRLNGEKYRGYSPAMPTRQIFRTPEGYLAIGRFKEVYLVPEWTYNVFNSLKETTGGAIGWGVHKLNRLMGTWKAIAILSSFPRFNVNNFIGDSWMAVSQAPNPAKLLKEVPFALSYVNKYLTAGKKLSPFLRKTLFSKNDPLVGEIHKFIEDNDVVRGYAETELVKIKKGSNVFGKAINVARSLSSQREAIMRSALASYLYREYKAGNATQLRKYFNYIDTKGLSDYDALGKISRDVLVDYQWASKTFNQVVRGGIMPFGQWYLKGSANQLRFMKKHFGRALVGYLTAPILASLWNDYTYLTGDDETKKFFHNMPDYLLERTSLVLGKSDDGRRYIMSFQLPQDVLIGTKIFTIATNQANLALMGRKTWEEAAVDTIKSTLTQEAKGIAFLTNPILRFLKGLSDRKDPYDNAPIYSIDYSDLKQIKGAFDIPYRLLWEQSLFFAKTMIPVTNVFVRSYTSGEPMDQAAKKFFESWLPEGALGIYRVSQQGTIEKDGQKLTFNEFQVSHEIDGRTTLLLEGLKHDWIQSGLSPNNYTQSDRYKKQLEKIRDMYASYVPEYKNLLIEDIQTALNTSISGKIGGTLASQNEWLKVWQNKAKTDEQKAFIKQLREKVQEERLIESLDQDRKATREVFNAWLESKRNKK